jgi:valyl-tRNA synthetase
MLPTRYQPDQIEDKIYAFWEEHRLFHAEATDAGEPYTIVIPPPNVTSFLHMGHALNNTLQDVFIRFQRMRGRNALWLPGMDHAGIATQNVVERQLATEGLHRRDLGREKFIERVWEWKEKFGGIIINQLRKLGCSCDWERERFTMDEGLSSAVRETFVRLYEKGLIYRGKYIVNWCPRCRTALSDIEVEHEEHDGHFWHLLYPLTDDPGRSVTVATTRPETMLGDTAVAVHPADERYADLIGRTVTLPIIGREIPIVADEMVDREFGTGAVKVTPAHDSNDFAVARRHDLPAVVVIDEDGCMTIDAGDAYEGMDRFECREALVEDLRARGNLLKVEPHQHAVGHCYRCSVVVEPYLSDQWYVKTAPLAGPAADVVRNGDVTFHPKRWADYYLSWLDEPRDWCISRQIWWGHQIPVWYCDACGEIVVSREDPTECPKCSSALRRDEDVLDTWFSSGLWPFSTLGWPDETPELAKYYPTSTLVTDRGIIYFWVARMVMLGLEFQQKIPFSDVVIHGTILDEQGRKMSKSLGNGIDPIDIINQYGADAARFSLVMLATEGQDLKLSVSRFEMGRNFCNKVWNAVRFAIMNLEHEGTPPEPGPAAFEDRWILSRLQEAVASATADLERFRTNEAGHTIYQFFWHSLCDWYLEIIKPRLRDGHDPADAARARQTLAHVLDTTLRLLHPIVPFLTEEIWQSLKVAAEGLSAADAMTGLALIRAPWPEADAALRDEALEQEMETLQEIIRAIRNVRKSKGVADRKPLDVVISTPDDATDAVIAARSEFLCRMAVLGGLEHAVSADKPERCATTIVGSIEVFLQLADLVDLDAERDRLGKQRKAVEAQIQGIEKTLHNTAFLAKAPEQVVAQKRAKSDELRSQLKKIIQNITDLG